MTDMLATPHEFTLCGTTYLMSAHTIKDFAEIRQRMLREEIAAAIDGLPEDASNALKGSVVQAIVATASERWQAYAETDDGYVFSLFMCVRRHAQSLTFDAFYTLCKKADKRELELMGVAYRTVNGLLEDTNGAARTNGDQADPTT